MRHIRINRGVRLSLPGEPRQSVRQGHSLTRLRLAFSDYSGLQLEPLVGTGERLQPGTPLAQDHREPRILLRSPSAASVGELVVDARRRLQAVVLDNVGAGGFDYPVPDALRNGTASSEAIVTALMQAGFWPAIRQRPYDCVASPDTPGDALMVTAMDSRPLSVDAGAVVRSAPDAFSAGVRLLSRLVPKTFVCQSPGTALLDAGTDDAIECVGFDGPHPAGLAGTHIATLAPVSPSRSVWHIGYQDVLAIGEWLLTEQVNDRIVVALGGPDVYDPHLVATRRGGYVEDILFGTRILSNRPSTILAGDPAAGRRISALGPFDRQLSVWPDSVHRATGDTHSQIGPVLPGAPWRSASPMPVLAVPLLRALCRRDVLAAARFGALSLGEDDMSPFSVVCPSRNRYGALLRDVHRIALEEPA